MKKSEYVVLDIETTGLSKHIHNITEIAAVKFCGKKRIGEFQTLVNPQEHIPSFITKLTGIDDAMVKDAPTIDQVLPGFFDFLGDSIIVAHNATFDYGFISTNAERHLGKGLDNDKLCTKKLARRLLPDLYSRRLGSVCEHLGIVNEQAHRAMGDVDATARVFHKFMSLLDKCGLDTRESVLKFESMPVWKATNLLNQD
ncbi:MAG: exonuclease domain-containing protein [Candidatus Woesearchaeota archaeon]